MASLLPGTFFIAGAHTIAWLPRPFQYCRQLMATHSLEDKGYFRRFQPLQRNLHLTVITSIFGLAITGMMLKFSCATWARFVAWLLGGFEAAGVIHRACATATFGYFRPPDLGEIKLIRV